MIVFGAADLHLKETIWKSKPEIAGDAYVAFARLVRIVSQEPGSVLLLGGDIFNSTYPDGLDEYAFATGMRKLTDSGHSVYGVSGNHDGEQYYRPWLFGLQPLTEIATDIGDGVTVAGIPYHRSGERLSTALSDAPVCDILVMHAGFRHLLGFEEACQCEIKDVPEHVGMVLNGHIHVKDVTGRVYSPGSLSVTNVAEFSAGHGVFRIDTASWEVTWIPIKTREFITVKWDDGPPTIPPSVGRRLPVLNLVFTSAQAADVAAFKAEYQDRAMFLDNMQTLETVNNQEALVMCEGLDVDRVIKESLQRRVGSDPEAAHVTEELLRTDTPAEWLTAYLAEKATSGEAGSGEVECK